MRLSIVLVALFLSVPVVADEPVLSPMLTSKLGEMMERDWKERPEWGEMMVMILKGERMGSGAGWFTGSQRRHDWNWLAEAFANEAEDQRIDRAEIPQLNDEAFDRVDRDQDGAITAADFQFSKNPFMEDDSPAGDIFGRLDDDSNGRLTMEELERWFKRSAGDTEFLSVDDLKGALGYNPKPPRPERQDDRPPSDPRWEMVQLLLTGEMGSFTEGPSLDDPAPELNLPLVAHKVDGTGLELTDTMVHLDQLPGDKPVVLIFGSFT